MKNKFDQPSNINQFYRMKYSRSGVIPTMVFLVMILLVANIFAFSIPLLLTSIGCILWFVMFYVVSLSKYLFSVIVFSRDGIELFYRGKVIEVLKWDDVINISRGHFLGSPTFELQLSKELSYKYKSNIFSFECDQNMLEVMKTLCTNPKISEELAMFRLRY